MKHSIIRIIRGQGFGEHETNCELEIKELEDANWELVNISSSVDPNNTYPLFVIFHFKFTGNKTK